MTVDVRGICELRAHDSADRPFLVLDEEEVSYGEFDRRVNRVANGLGALGVERGTVVALLLGNRQEFLYVWFALAKLGAVAAPVNVAFAAPEAQYLLDHSGAAFLVAEPTLYERSVAPVRDALPGIRTLVSVGDGAQAAGAVPFAEVLAGSSALPAPLPLSASTDPFTILYTSGTTGYPKGCVLSQSYFPLNGAALCHGMGIGSSDRLLMSLPLFHVNAEITVLGAMVNRAAYILRPRFSASAFWDEARRFRATAFNHVGMMISILAKQPPGPGDLKHSVRVACGGGAPVDLIPAFRERFGVTLVELYATTESCMDTMGSVHAGEAAQPRGTAGSPVWLKEVAIRGQGGVFLGAGEVGEIVTRPKIEGVTMSEYFRDPEGTAEALRDGWFHSGDLGRLDEGGFLTFVDREKHIVRRGGENISSLEVERVLKQHPGVLEVAVVPVKDEIRGEEAKACVVPRPEARDSFDPAALLAFCEGRLAPFKIPRYVKVYEALPVTETQRIKKHELKAEPAPLAGAYDREAAAGILLPSLEEGAR